LSYVVLVGPGKNFGMGLLKELTDRGYDVVVVSLSPEKYTLPGVIGVQCDLADTESVGLACKQINAMGAISSVIFAAKSPKLATDISQVAEINTEMQINFMSAVQIYAELSPKIINGGKFVCIGGNYAAKPSPSHIGLSLSKAALRNFAQMYADGSIPTKLVTIEGAITPDKIPKIIESILAVIDNKTDQLEIIV
jgi:NAD(P)-dependent dehydrogenase (short-subunit alcohol dehydrogenase family)